MDSSMLKGGKYIAVHDQHNLSREQAWAQGLHVYRLA